MSHRRATLPRRAGRELASVTFALMAALSSADAQPGSPGAPERHARDGLWIGFGGGPGYFAVGCVDGCGMSPSSPAWNGGLSGGGHFVIGGALRPDLLLGLQSGGQERVSGEDGESAAELRWVSAVAQWYPRPRRGLFVRAGAGLGGAFLQDTTRVLVDRPVPRRARARASANTLGVSLQGGVGYDVRFGGRFGLTPFAEYVILLGNRLEAHNRDGRRTYVGPRLPSALQAGLSFNWY